MAACGIVYRQGVDGARIVGRLCVRRQSGFKLRVRVVAEVCQAFAESAPAKRLAVHRAEADIDIDCNGIRERALEKIRHGVQRRRKTNRRVADVRSISKVNDHAACSRASVARRGFAPLEFDLWLGGFRWLHISATIPQRLLHPTIKGKEKIRHLCYAMRPLDRSLSEGTKYHFPLSPQFNSYPMVEGGFLAS
jgi:hypothetical protein